MIVGFKILRICVIRFSGCFVSIKEYVPPAYITPNIAHTALTLLSKKNATTSPPTISSISCVAIPFAVLESSSYVTFLLSSSKATFSPYSVVVFSNKSKTQLFILSLIFSISLIISYATLHLQNQNFLVLYHLPKCQF